MQRRPKVDTRPLSFAEDDGLNTPLKSITATTPGNASSSSSSGSPTKQKRATSSSRKARLSSPARILFNYAVKWPLVFLCGYAFILSMLIMYPPIHPFLVYVHWLNFPWNLRNAEVYGFRDLSVRSFRFKTIDNVSLGAWHVFPRSHSATSLFSSSAAVAESSGVLEVISEESSIERIRNASRVFLYFHGNAGNRATFHRTAFYRRMTSMDESHLIAIDYRGFGDSDQITPSESGLQIDALSAYDYIHKTLSVPHEKIIIIGHSLGSGVATYLARQLTVRGIRPGGLMLVSAYLSIPDAAMAYPMIPLLYPFKNIPMMRQYVRRVLSEKWESDVSLGGHAFDFDSSNESATLTSSLLKSSEGGVACPIFIVHGGSDVEIPVKNGRGLFIQAVKGHMLVESQQTSPSLSITKKLDAVFLPRDARPSGISKHDGFTIRPIGGEAHLWTESDETKDSSGHVWFLEIRHGGHNNIQNFEIMTHAFSEWLSLNKI